MDRRTVLRGFLTALASGCAGRSARPSSASAGDEPADLLIVGAKLFPSPDARPIEDAVVAVRAGRIVAAGAAAEVGKLAAARTIDGRGGAVAAGFWNCHVHVFTRELLRAEGRSEAELSAALERLLTRWGFTTVVDIASFLDNTNHIRQRIAEGAVKGPNILTTGEPFFPPNGLPIYIREFVRQEKLVVPETTTIPDAVARARRQFAAGADALKLFTGSIVGGDIGVLPMERPLAEALVKEAHRAGKPVFAHPSNLEGLRVAIEAGVDILAHTAPEDGPWSPEVARRIVERRMALVPTLTLFDIDPKRFGAPKDEAARMMAAALQQVGAFARAGGDLLFGTDVGYIDVFDTAPEFNYMRQAGLEFPAILASLTTTPARRFGQGDRKGRVVPGHDADLVLLEGDPTADAAALSRMRAVIRGGHVIYGG